MTGQYRGLDTDRGYVQREFRKIWKAIRESEAGKRLQAATIGRGGLTVTDGGTIASTYPNGQKAARFGPYVDSGGNVGHGFYLRDENDTTDIFGFIRYPPQAGVPAGATVGQVSADAVTFIGRDSIFFTAAGQYFQVDATGSQISHTTTSAASNAVLDAANGLLRRSTSSMRYKQDVGDVTIDPTVVLKMRPRTWRDRSDVERDPAKPKWYVGFIAEELVDLGGGLEKFVTRDKDGQPDAIDYDRLTVALLEVVKSQATKTETQGQEIAALKVNVGKLAGALGLRL